MGSVRQPLEHDTNQSSLALSDYTTKMPTPDRVKAVEEDPDVSLTNQSAQMPREGMNVEMYNLRSPGKGTEVVKTPPFHVA